VVCVTRPPRLRREGSLADRIGQAAAARDLARAERAYRREQRGLRRASERLTGPPPVGRHGAYGRQAGRVAWLMSPPPLVTTSAQLCSVFPFVTDPGLGVDGPLIGLEVYSRSAFTFSLHELYRARLLTAPNMVVSGKIGSAKSSLLKTIAFRSVPFGQRFYIVDVKGEYEQLAAAVGITPLRIGPGLGVAMNPLAAIRRHPGHNEQQWRQLQRSRRLLLLEGLLEIQLGDRLVEAERSLLEFAVDAVTREHDATADRLATPTLSSVLAATGRPELWQHHLNQLGYPLHVFVEESRRLRLALQRLISGALGGVFDGPPDASVRLDFAQPGAILDLRAVRASDAMTAMAMTCAQSWLEAELSTPDAPPRICLYDEFALLARHVQLMRRMREQLKLARALGIGNILALHRFSDLAAAGSADSEQVRIARGLIEDCGVRVSYQQDAGSLTQAQELLGSSDVETDLLRRLRQGVGLWMIGTRSYVVRHQLSRAETAMVATDSRMDATPQPGQLDGAEYEARLEAAADGTSA
jgi:hypothetical protein